MPEKKPEPKERTEEEKAAGMEEAKEFLTEMYHDFVKEENEKALAIEGKEEPKTENEEKIDSKGDNAEKEAEPKIADVKEDELKAENM